MRSYLYGLRKANCLSQREMAKKLNISESYYCQIEKGNRKQTLDLPLAFRIAEIFNIDVKRIFELEKTNQ